EFELIRQIERHLTVSRWVLVDVIVVVRKVCGAAENLNRDDARLEVRCSLPKVVETTHPMKASMERCSGGLELLGNLMLIDGIEDIEHCERHSDRVKVALDVELPIGGNRL